MAYFQTSSMDLFLIEDFEEKDAQSKKKKRIILITVATVMLTIALTVGLGVGLSSFQSDSPFSELFSDDAKDDPGCFKNLQFPSKNTIDVKRKKGGVLDKAEAGECPFQRQISCPSGKKNPLLIILSLDGFRAEYLLRNMTPNLGLLQKCGASTDYMRPVFPSKTFPNHYTIVTGLYAESHGIIDNNFYDPSYKEYFKYGGRNLSDNRWWSGEPIYNTAKKQGKKVATMMWTGSDVNIQDMRPDICYNYNKSLPLSVRTNEILNYFNDPATSPDLVLLYFEQPDSAGHSKGPYDDWVNSNLTMVDSLVGSLINGLDDRGFSDCFNLIVVADHGMEAFDCKHVVNISKYIDPSEYKIYSGPHARLSSAYNSLNPIAVNVTLSKLECRGYDEIKDWYSRFHAKQDLPRRYHFSNNIRIDEVVVDMQKKYTLDKNTKCSVNSGNHGSDNTFKGMHSIFIAFGSSFKNIRVEPFENIHLYNLFTDILGLKPAPNNGTIGVLHSVLNISPTYLSNHGQFQTSKLTGCPVPDEGQFEEIRLNSDCTIFANDCPNGGMINVDDLDNQLRLDRSEIDKSLKTNAPFGIPVHPRDYDADSSCLLIQKDYVAKYDSMLGVPLWTSFTVNYQKIDGSNVLSKNYSVDKVVNGCIRRDVRLSHSINCTKYSNNDMNIEAAFLYPPGLISNYNRTSNAYLQSNLVPMYKQFKDGVWKETMHLLEEYIEKYVWLNILIGPIYDFNADGLADNPEDLTDFVDEGKKIAIPSHYFVLLLRCDGMQQQPTTNCTSTSSPIAFIMPHVQNTGNCWDYRIADYIRENVARVKDIELLTNLSLMTSIDDVENRARIVTKLEEELWSGLTWLDDVDHDGCPVVPDDLVCPAEFTADEKPLLLISLDGVRPDYISEELTPTLYKLMMCGSTVPYLLPVYPTHTFPNHYSIVTGNYPESHGIVDNNMYDMTMNLSFSLGSTTTNDSRWWIGEPLWVTLEKLNKTAMTYFWPGSDVIIHGYRPSVYKNYDGAVPNTLRVSTVLDWLNNSTGKIPDLVLLYFSDVDNAGHDGGHDSVQVRESLEEVDKVLAQLMNGLHHLQMENCINIIITSDHGMSEMSCDRSITLTDYLSSEILAKTYTYQGSGPRIANQYFKKGQYYYKLNDTSKIPTVNLTSLLNCVNDRMLSFNKLLTPRSLHYINNQRIDDVLIMAAETWLVNKNSPYCPIKGQHGWSQKYNSMKAMFLGYGRDFKPKFFHNESFENIELLNLMAYLTNVSKPANNGTEGSLNFLLKNPPPIPNLPVGLKYDECSFPDSQKEYKKRVEQKSIGCSCDNFSDNNLNKTKEEIKQLTSIYLSHGVPILTGKSQNSTCRLVQHNYVLAFNKNLKLPIYAAFKNLNASEFQAVEFESLCMRPDVRLLHDQQLSCSQLANLSHYNSTPVTLFPSDFSNEYYNDTQIITNIVPMYSTFYLEVWKPVLISYLKNNLNLDLIVGPIFDYDGDGLADQQINNYIENIPTPSHYFLIVLHCFEGACEDQSFSTVSYILPNVDFSPASICQTVDEYKDMHVSRIRDVELLTNLQFLTSKNTQQAISTRLRTPNTISFRVNQ